MSTRIYNGYAMRRMPLDRLHEVMGDFQIRIQKATEQLIARAEARICADALDRTAAGLHGLDAFYKPESVYQGATLLGAAARDVERSHRRAQESLSRLEPYDMACSVVVVPTAARLLCLLFTERPELKTQWEKTAGVSPYPYWNNTDPPNGVSWRTWRMRGQEWDRALGYRPPFQCGFTVECCGTFLPNPTYQQVLSALPSFSSRVGFISREIAYNRMMAPHKRQLLKAGTDTQVFVRLDREVREKLGSAIGRRLIREVERKTRKVLQKRIAACDLGRQVRVDENRLILGRPYR